MELAIGPEEGISYLTDKGCSVSLLWGVLGLLSVAHWPPSTPGGLAGDRESGQCLDPIWEQDFISETACYRMFQGLNQASLWKNAIMNL